VSVIYYVALPFVRTEDGSAPGQAMECQSESQALSRAGAMSRDLQMRGLAFKRAAIDAGDFSDAIILRTSEKCRTSSTNLNLVTRIRSQLPKILHSVLLQRKRL